jgi:release factor glutamine methyltransferase
MLTIQTALGPAAKRLKAAGSPSPALDAQIWLAHILGWSRERLLAHPERELSGEEETQFQQGVVRMAAGEPLPYLTGQVEFYGLTFHVTPATLIPRPETEHLVEAALDHIMNQTPHSVPLRETRSGIKNRKSSICDIGTGSGCIVVSLAVHLPDATLFAIDISSAALEVAARNAQRHGVAERISFLQGHLLDPLPGRVDLIVANLPYVADDEWESLPVVVREHEPARALRGGVEGLDLIEELLQRAPASLHPNGVLLLEIGAAQGPAAMALARAQLPGAEVKLRQDFAGRDRLLLIQL